MYVTQLPHVITSVLALVIPAWTVNGMLNLLIPLQKKSAFFRTLSVPLDGNIMLGKNRLLGNSTTLLGLATAVITGLLIELIFPSSEGLVIGLGMYIGHFCGSFIKRRLHIKSGEFLPIVDHGDGIIVTGGILSITNMISLEVYLISIVVTLIAYPIICRIAYIVHLREKPL